MIVVLFGVAGVGKSTVGRSLAQKLGWEFYDADNFHPAANIKKMKQGIALSDEDRQPWLEKLRQLIEHCLTEQENAVFCVLSPEKGVSRSSLYQRRREVCFSARESRTGRRPTSLATRSFFAGGASR